MDPRAFVDGVEGDAKADTHTVEEGDDDLLFAALEATHEATPPTQPPAGDFPATDQLNPRGVDDRAGDEPGRVADPTNGTPPPGAVQVLRVPVVANTPSSLPVHQGRITVAPGSAPVLPSPELLVYPAEPEWHPPFTKPEPRMYFGGRLGKGRMKFWETQRSNHEHMCARQRQDYRDAVAAHEAAVEQMRACIAYQLISLYKWGRKRSSTVIVPAHSKGGVGKSPSSVSIAGIVGMALRVPVFLVDGNFMSGGAERRSGIDYENAVSMSWLLENFENLTMSQLLEQVHPTEYNVITIASDPDNVVKPSARKFTDMIEKLKEFTPVIVIDTGNDILGALNRAMYRLADVLLFPMITTYGARTVNGPVDDLLGTMHKLDLLAEKNPRVDGELVHKTRLGVSVAIGMRDHQDPAEFQAAIGPDRLMKVIPYDTSAANTDPLVLPTRDGPLTPQAGVISPYTMVAWAEVANAAFAQAEALDQLRETEDLQLDFPATPSGQPDDGVEDPPDDDEEFEGVGAPADDSSTPSPASDTTQKGA